MLNILLIVAIPSFNDVMLPFLKFLSDGKEHSLEHTAEKIGDVEIHLAEYFGLTEEERSQLKPTGGEGMFIHIIRWCSTHFKAALLVESTRRSHIKILPKGLEALNQNPEEINPSFLRTISPEYVEYMKRTVSDLDKEIKKFDKNRNFSKTKPEAISVGQNQRDEFVKKFPSDEILDTKLENYVAGKTPLDKNTFSYQLEFGTKNFAQVQGGEAKKFVIYVDKASQLHKFDEEVFDSKDDAYAFTINGINDLIKNGNKFDMSNGDWDTLEQNVEGKEHFLNVALRSKILQLYFPEKFIKIHSHKWMNAALDYFKINRGDLEERKDFYIKQGRIRDFQNNHQILKEWNTAFFSSFLDKERLFGNATEDVDSDTADLHEIVVGEEYENYYEILNRKKQLIFYGPPGTGKTYTANNFAKWIISKKNNMSSSNDFEKYIHKVTFHPSYSYEEFVEGIKPKLESDKIGYEIENGIFKNVCEKAEEDEKNYYILIIDEINRGNIPKIFGELITLIESDKREEHYLSLTYTKKPFSVPDNLLIIGTMNTADRSLTQLDVALRRRFGFSELMPNYDLIANDVNGIKLEKLLKFLNQKIRDLEGREKQIGHSYFMKDKKPLENIEDLKFVFSNEIIPLLQDYFYEDYHKIHEILGSKFVDLKNMEIRPEWKENSKDFEKAVIDLYK